jgi:uncharacterized membrane protein
MQNYIEHALENFRPVFSRSSTWLLFCAIMMGFMGAGEIMGVTSLCRFWLLDADGYNRLLHFFRSKAYHYVALLGAWQVFCQPGIFIQKKAEELGIYYANGGNWSGNELRIF